MTKEKKSLTVICPVHNEHEIIESFYVSLNKVILDIQKEYDCKILFVVDKS